MKKRIIAFVVFIVCMVRLIPISAIATEVINNYSEENNARIEELFEQRNELVKNYEENKEEICIVDEKLKALGVVFLDEQSQIQGIESTGNSRSNSDGITWTSTTFNHVYAGAVFEVELIRGTPAHENSSLFYSGGYTGSTGSVREV